MSSELLIHASGLAALVINVLALLCRCDLAMRRQSVVAGCLWTLNNVLIDATAAAALSAVSVSRTVTSAATLERSHVARRNTCAFFTVLTLAAGALTWNGWLSAVTLAASIISTWAMFYLRGATLRLVMLLVSGMWMVNAWQYASWEQMAANLVTAGAAAYGAWQLSARKSVAADAV